MNTRRPVPTPMRLCALLVSLSVSLSAVGLQAPERKGARVLIDMKDGSEISGELIQIHETGVTIRDSWKATLLLVAISDVRSLTIVKKAKAGSGAAVGLLGGAFTGFVTGWLFVGAVLFGIVGTIAGAIAGVFAGVDKTIMCDGKTPEEHRKILGALEKYAQIRANPRVSNQARIPRQSASL